MRANKIILYTALLCVVLPSSYMCYSLFTNTSKRIYCARTSKEKQKLTSSSSSQETYTIIEEINAYLSEQAIDSNRIGVSIYDPINKQRYDRNAYENFTSASLYKVPLAMLYYDYIEAGSMQLEDTLLYTSNCYEEGGPIGYTYQVGTFITLKELLYDMIVYSDNTAGHILFESLGGWESYRTFIQTYSHIQLNTDAISYNELPAAFTTDVLTYIYEHKSKYTDLLAHMKLVCPNDYLNKRCNASIAQKYGSFKASENAMGIVFGNHPYIITITTTLYTQGIDVIGDINALVYQIMNENSDEF